MLLFFNTLNRSRELGVTLIENCDEIITRAAFAQYGCSDKKIYIPLRGMRQQRNFWRESKQYRYQNLKANSVIRV